MPSRDVSTANTSPVVYYVQPGAQTPTLYDPAQLAEQRHRDAVLYARWVERQAAFRERDRRTRRLALRIAAVATAVLLGGGAVLGWLTYRAVTSAAADIGAVLAGAAITVLVLAALAAGGHRCVTIVKHWH